MEESTTEMRSGALMLDQDIVQRAAALRGGQEPDGPFILALLREGLESMERKVAAAGKAGCGDPNCKACAARAESRPDPSVEAEFWAMYDRILELNRHHYENKPV